MPNSRSPDPVTLLKQDHREAKQLLKRLTTMRPGKRRKQTVTKLTQALQLHMQLEERLVYPLVRTDVGVEPVEEAAVEHGLARDGLRKLNELTDAPGFGAAVAMVTAGINHHVKEEEHEVFPKLKREAEPAAIRRLGTELAAAKKATR